MGHSTSMSVTVKVARLQEEGITVEIILKYDASATSIYNDGFSGPFLASCEM